MTNAASLDLAASRQALADLRHARRHNHRLAVHWVDALYRVYMTGLIAVVVVIVGTGFFGDMKLTPSETVAFADRATPWLGLAFAVAAGIGLRSGGRGGPLTLQAATVQHELLAPIDAVTVFREPALKQLRFLAFSGSCTGAVVAAIGVRRLPVPPMTLMLTSAVAFGSALVLAVSLAMIFSGRRLGIRVANGLAVGLLAWSAVDIAAGLGTSPFTWLGHLAFTAVSFEARSVLPVLVVPGAVVLALIGLGGTSVDDARRRAGLVAQLRFAVTLQDIRTVVLLRRQLAQETPRSRPWIPIGRGRRLPPVWRRDWHSYFRFPAVRVGRMVLLSFIAGLMLGVTWNGVHAAFLLTALALYLVAYEVVEPLGQEVDHPSRWDGIPQDHGLVLLRHLPAAYLVMLVMTTLGAAASLVFVPASVVEAEWVLIPFVALAAVAGAALSTVMGAPDMAKFMAGPGADVMGFILLFRMVFPPAITVAALAPIFLAGNTPEQLSLDRMQDFLGYAVFLPALALMFVRYRKPARV